MRGALAFCRKEEDDCVPIQRHMGTHGNVHATEFNSCMRDLADGRGRQDHLPVAYLRGLGRLRQRGTLSRPLVSQQSCKDACLPTMCSLPAFSRCLHIFEGFALQPGQIYYVSRLNWPGGY